MNLYLNETLLEFKIDIGAEITVIPESVATPFQSHAVKEEIYVVKNLHTPLLELLAIYYQS